MSSTHSLEPMTLNLPERIRGILTQSSNHISPGFQIMVSPRTLPFASCPIKLIQHVLPCLLNPLQTNGQSIKPCLVHGNLNVENVPTNLATGSPILFDGAALYAHHEYELGMWRRATVNFDDKYFRQYFKHYPPSQPIEHWEDRVCLYSLKFNLAYMVSCPGSEAVRNQYVYPLGLATAVITELFQGFMTICAILGGNIPEVSEIGG